MKYSVLIPTRNRLDYLKYAIESVRQQKEADWEIIVSDNDSQEDIRGYVEGLEDDRIRYFRTSSFLPVTESWNFALDQAKGDYVIMLGDDDCLMQGYFQRMDQLLQEYPEVDFLYSSALQFIYPGVIPGAQQERGVVHLWGNAACIEGKTAPYILPREEALKEAKKSLNFKVAYNFNMQFSLVKRTLIEEMKRAYGSFYQSPYPDYYATTTLFIKAKQILIVPEPLVVIGICPKSFGYFYFNQKEKQGKDFLKNIPDKDLYQQVQAYLLPGTDMNDSWLLAMETVRRNFSKEFSLQVSYPRYRFLQFFAFLKAWCSKECSFEELKPLASRLSVKEKLRFYPLFVPVWLLRNRLVGNKRQGIFGRWTSLVSHPTYTIRSLPMHYSNILQVFESLPVGSNALKFNGQ